MRILIVSDTHKQNKNLIRVLDQTGKIDLFLHMGDSEGGEDYIAELVGCPSQFVRGNNDYFSELEKEKIITIGKYRVLLTHGHYYYVSFGTEELKKEARARDIDIVMFGHTHRPVVEIDEDVTVLNPGSLSYPRQEGRKPSYIIMELDQAGEAHYTINYL